MKRKCSALIAPMLSVLLCLLLAAAPVSGFAGEEAAASAAPKKDLTLMVYMCGSNLESQYGSASADYQEMVDAGLDPNVSVLVMMGGTTSWQMELNAENAAVMELSDRGARRIRDTEKRNMGDPATLADFLLYAREQCPAKGYALILWDHGGGPLDGLCWDEQYGADHLSMAEMTSALREAGFDRQKLRWIGFDACLMSSAEVAAAVAPYAEYMVSSQAEEPASGWNYAFLRELGKDRDAEETGRRIVDAYFSGQEDAARDLTLACLRLSALPELAASMDEFFSELTGVLNRDTFSDISRMRMGAAGFGRAGETVPGETGYDLVDLLSLTESYASRNPEKARLVAEALGRVVVCKQSNVKESCGLSVYHPWRNREKYRSEWQDAYAALSFCAGYTRYVNSYGGIMLGDHLVLWDRLDRLDVYRDQQSAYSRITAELTEDQAANLANARLVILARNLFDAADESYYQVYRSLAVQAEGTFLSAAYDGRHLRAVNASGYDYLTGALSYSVTEEDVYQIRFYPFDSEGKRSDRPVLAEYVKDDSDQFRLKDYLVQDPLTGTWTSRADVDLSRYAGVTFINEYRTPTVNSRNEILSFDQWQEDAHADTHMKARYDEDRTDFSLAFGTELHRAESLYAAFEITDTQGYRVMTSLIPLEGGGVQKIAVDTGAGEGGYTLNGRDTDLSCSLFLQPSSDSVNSRIMLNVSLRNPLDEDLTFLLTDVTLNGKESDAGALSTQGTGALGQADRRSLAPGETGAATLILRYDQLTPLIPDVSLTEIGFTLALATVRNGGNDWIAVKPFTLTTEIPLSVLYPETDVLPPDGLVSLGREIGALDADSEKLLFSAQDCRITLRGIYVMERNIVLLLHYENDGTLPRHLILGNAKTDGRPAALGLSTDPIIETRNRRVESYHLSHTPWESPAGVFAFLDPGRSHDEYVVVKPEEGMTEVRSLSLQLYIYEDGNPQDAAYFGDAVISAEEAAPLQDGFLGVAPAEDYTVTEGQPMPAEAERVFFEDQIPDAGSAPSFAMRVSDSPEDPVAAGAWALFRRVSSDAELAEMNIMNPINEKTGEPVISFAGGREWLIFEAGGELTPQADGSAAAVFPGLLPVVRTGGEGFRLKPVYIYNGPDGRVMYKHAENHLSFGSGTFPGAVLKTAIRSTEVAQDPETGRVTLAGSECIGGSWPSLAEMANQKVWLVPADADTDELLSFLNGDRTGWPYALRQHQQMHTPKLSLALEPIPDPEKYAVVYYYVTEGNLLRSTLPEPLVP